MPIQLRLSIAALASARARRESYVGPWLPEPVDTSTDPLLGAERAEALSLAVLLLLERLAPAERAAFVLHAAFDYPHARIAEVLETSVANARQLYSRARKHLDEARGREVDPANPVVLEVGHEEPSGLVDGDARRVVEPSVRGRAAVAAVALHPRACDRGDDTCHGVHAANAVVNRVGAVEVSRAIERDRLGQEAHVR